MRSFIAKKIIAKYKLLFFCLCSHLRFYIPRTWFDRLRWNVESVGDEVAAEATHEGRHWTQHQGSHLKMILYICVVYYTGFIEMLVITRSQKITGNLPKTTPKDPLAERHQDYQFRRINKTPDERRFFTRPQRTPARARLELSSSRTLHGLFTSLLVTCLMRMVALETTYLVIEESIDEGRDPDESEDSLVLTGQLLASLDLSVAPESIQ